MPAPRMSMKIRGGRLRAGSAGGWINAKSPNAVMKLKAGHGETLHLRADGADAGQAVAALCALIDRDFAD